MLDADDAPGGAWQHRWDSLTMHDVHGVAALPDADAPGDAGGRGRANAVVPAYFAAYERTHDLPVAAAGAGRPGRRDDDGLLVVRAGERRWTTRTLVNATGTWSQPHLPHYPGIETFRGEQLHTVVLSRRRSTSAAGASSSWAAAPPRPAPRRDRPGRRARCG